MTMEIESVFERDHEYRKEQKRRKRNSIIAIASSAALFLTAGAIGSFLPASFRTSRYAVQVSSVTLDYEKMEYEVFINYNLSAQQPIHESYFVNDVKPGPSPNGRAKLLTRYDLWGNFRGKKLIDVYYGGEIEIKQPK